jgi:hypothetical protein
VGDIHRQSRPPHLGLRFPPAFDALFRPVFAFFIINHDTREVVYLNASRFPSDEWVA